MIVPRPAATVALLRDGHHGLETYLLQRNPALEFVPGASVFPGGAVDDGDLGAEWWGRCDGPSDTVAAAELGVQRGGLGYRVAAVRECFEEVGVLLGGPPGIDRHRPLASVCDDDGVRLATADLRYFGHWITPEGAPRRYDTRFFFAVCPADHEPEPDNDEALDGHWIAPDQALAEAEDGRRDLILPTARTLEALHRLGAVEAVLAAVPRATSPIRRRLIDDHGGARVPLPHDD
ncbi:MAG: NUDIX hydrolase [Acidimicrobiia bacterium]|nr:NUDIX hydrolase [Acidimicrobiia bacterium]